jgi:RNA polymerase sigma-70 factor (ECF subfamily)
MDTTSLSLLDRLKHAGPDAVDWRRLHDVYHPFIRCWLSEVPGLCDEADDLSQQVFIVLVQELPRFERQRHGSFRAWLRKVAINRVRTYWKSRRKVPRAGLGEDGEKVLAQLEDPGSELAKQWDRDHDKHVLHKLLSVVQSDFEIQTWHAFTRFALDGLPVVDVARELNLSPSAVVQAKSRVLKRLREEAGELVD